MHIASRLWPTCRRTQHAAARLGPLASALHAWEDVEKHSKLIIVLGALFVLAGAAKLLSMDAMVLAFQRWGLSDSLRFVVGMVEAVAGVMLMFSFVHRIAAVMLMPVMMGAVYTHVFRGDWAILAMVPLLMIGVLIWIAFRPSQTKRRAPWLHRPAVRAH